MDIALYQGDKIDGVVGEYQAGHYKENGDNKILLNTDKIDLSDSGSYIKALSHENFRAANSENYDKDTETNLATSYGQRTKEYWNENYRDDDAYQISSITSNQWRELNKNSPVFQNKYVNNLDASKVDPLSQIVEFTLIEGPSIYMGTNSAMSNFKEEQYFDAMVDLAGVGVDTFFALIPGVIGGSGFAIQASRKGASKKIRDITDDVVNSIKKNGNKRDAIDIKLPSGVTLKGVSQKVGPSGAKKFTGATKKQQQEVIDSLTKGAGKPKIYTDLRKGGEVKVYLKKDGTTIKVRTESTSNHGNVNIDITSPLKPGQTRPDKYELKFD